MPVWPSEHEDTVLYEAREIVSSKDLVLRAIDDGTISVWGDLYVNGEIYHYPVSFDVRKYGAVGDGVTDNTAAINSAILECSSQGGGVVYFPAGDFAFTGLIHFNDPKVSVQGAGQSTTILRPQTLDSLILVSKTTDPISETFVHRWGFLRDFSVNAALANVGIRIGLLCDAGFQNIHVRESKQAAWQLWGTQNCKFIACGTVQCEGIGTDIDYTASGNSWFGYYSNDAGLYHVKFGNGSHPFYPGAIGPSNNEFYSCFFERVESTTIATIWHQGGGWNNRFYGCRLVGSAPRPPEPYYFVVVEGVNTSFLEFSKCRFYGDFSRLLLQTGGAAVTFSECTGHLLSDTDPWVTSDVKPNIRFFREQFGRIPPTAGIKDSEVFNADCMGLYLDGTAGNGPSTPSHSSLDITGDITLMVWVKFSNYFPAAASMLMSKYGASGFRSYDLRLTANGQCGIRWSVDGATVTSHVPTHNFVNGAGYWIAATLDVDNGLAQHQARVWNAYGSPGRIPNPEDWRQIGSPRTTAGTTSIFASTESLWVGSDTGGTLDMATGIVARAIVCNNIGAGGLPGSSVVADWRGDVPTGSAKYRDRTGKIWTLNGTNWAWSNLA